MPDSSYDILLSSLTSSSTKQYNTAWKKWWSFCTDKDISCFQPSVKSVLQFLTDEFHKGASLGSLNSFRSAIAFIVGPHIGEDFRIKRFFKGVFKLRPGTPKYQFSWNPAIVLDHLSSWGHNTTLDLVQLTGKVASLLALATGQRVQTLSLIDIRNIVVEGEIMHIRIEDFIKTSKPNVFQPTLHLPFFISNPNLCVPSAVLHYLERTQNLRPQSCYRLFVSCKKPWNQASSQTISRWIKNILASSGIDTKIFTAHSTRHAATSTAARHAVSIDVIRKTAGWSMRSNTFARFYNRPLETSTPEEFAKAVFAK